MGKTDFSLQNKSSYKGDTYSVIAGYVSQS